MVARSRSTGTSVWMVTSRFWPAGRAAGWDVGHVPEVVPEPAGELDGASDAGPTEAGATDAGATDAGG